MVRLTNGPRLQYIRHHHGDVAVALQVHSRQKQVIRHSQRLQRPLIAQRNQVVHDPRALHKLTVLKADLSVKVHHPEVAEHENRHILDHKIYGIIR